MEQPRSELTKPKSASRSNSLYHYDSFIENVSLLAEKKENFLYIEQKYGGHLGFYEGGYVIPNQITWLDKSVVGLADALAAYASSGKQVNMVARWL